MAEKLHQADTERLRKRQEWAAKHRSPTPETRVRAPVPVDAEPVRSSQKGKDNVRKPDGKPVETAPTKSIASGKESSEPTRRSNAKQTPSHESTSLAQKDQQKQTSEREDRWENPTKVVIPLPGGKKIEVSPPDRKHRVWKVTVPEIVQLGRPLEGEKVRRLTKNIPTPFFGLALHLGVELGAKAECKALPLGPLEVEYDAQTGQATIQAKASAMMGVSIWAGLRAGVAGDLWLVEAGVGLKAKIIAGIEKKVEGGIAFGYNVRKGGMPQFGVNLDLTPFEIALKGAVALFCYYDALFISTYEKTWTLYERTLGKLTVAGVKLSWSTAEGFKVEPKALDVQDLEGNIRSLFPSKSR